MLYLYIPNVHVINYLSNHTFTIVTVFEPQLNSLLNKYKIL